MSPGDESKVFHAWAANILLIELSLWRLLLLGILPASGVIGLKGWQVVM